MTRADLLRELRECASLEDREIARARADEALADYDYEGSRKTYRTVDGFLRWVGGRDPDRDDEITAAYKAAIRMEED